MLSAAKHLAADRDRPFASLRVTGCDCSNCQGQFFTIEPCLTENGTNVSLNNNFRTQGSKVSKWVKRSRATTSFSRVAPGNQSLLPGKDSRLCPIQHVEFAQDIADMPLDRLFADDKLIGNFGIGEPIGDEAQDL
jgi:hypothetical protein